MRESTRTGLGRASVNEMTDALISTKLDPFPPARQPLTPTNRSTAQHHSLARPNRRGAIELALSDSLWNREMIRSIERVASTVLPELKTRHITPSTHRITHFNPGIERLRRGGIKHTPNRVLTTKHAIE